MSVNEYKILLEKKTKLQQNKLKDRYAGEEIKRIKFQKVNFDLEHKKKRIISLDSDLPLNPLNIAKSVTNCKPTKLPVVKERIVIQLNDYLTLNEKNEKVNIVQFLNSTNKKKVQNSESSKNTFKKVKTDKIEINNDVVENKSLNPANNNLLVTQVLNNRQTHESHKKIPYTFVPDKINTNNRNSVIIQQPVVNHRTPVISNLPTIYQHNSIIQPKSTILPRPIFLQSKSIVINVNPLIIETKPMNIYSKKQKQNFNVIPQHHLSVQSNSKMQQDNLLNIVVPRKKETVFPVALKPSDSSDFEYVKLLNNNPVNENDIHILGI